MTDKIINKGILNTSILCLECFSEMAIVDRNRLTIGSEEVRPSLECLNINCKNQNIYDVPRNLFMDLTIQVEKEKENV